MRTEGLNRRRIEEKGKNGNMGRNAEGHLESYTLETYYCKHFLKLIHL